MRLHRNIYAWYGTTFFASAAFTLPIWVIFNTEVLGLSNTQAYILGVLPYGLSALFEVPTGSWADKYGRSKIYRLGMILYILSISSYIIFQDFYILLFFQTLGGLGLAMQSGGLEALVNDSIQGKNKDAIYSQVHGRKMAILFISRVITVLLGGFLFAVNPKLPFVVATAAYILGLLVSLFFKEIRMESATTVSSFNHIKETARIMLARQTLVIFFGLIVVYTFVSEALFALYQPYFQSISISIGQFGLFYAIISAFSAIGALSVTRLAIKHNAFTLLLFMMLSVLCTLSIMLLRVPMLTYIAIIPSALAFGYIITLQNAATQKMVSSRHQATAVSLASFVRTFAFLLSTVAVGAALDLVGVANVNVALAIITATALIPFALSVRRKITV